MEKTTVYLPRELQRQLQEASRRSGQPQAELVREAIAAYLRAQPRRQPRFVGMGEDAELSSDEAKGWIRARWDDRRSEAGD
jgi:predicted transcriptional regulator